jgi:hypothetical protein
LRTCNGQRCFGQDSKAEIDKWDYIKLKMPLSYKGNNPHSEDIKPIEREKIFINYLSDKLLHIQNLLGT